MNALNHRRMAVAWIVIVSACVILFGWATDNVRLVRGNTHWVSVKLPTAVMFLVSGAAIASMKNRCSAGMRQLVAVSFLSQFLVMHCVMLIFMSTVALNIGIFFEDSSEFTVSTQMPSLGTLSAFMICGISGVIWLFNTKHARGRLFCLAAGLAALAISCFIGYLFHLPQASFYLAGSSSAMSPISAGLFLVLAYGYVCLGRLAEHN